MLDRGCSDCRVVARNDAVRAGAAAWGPNRLEHGIWIDRVRYVQGRILNQTMVRRPMSCNSASGAARAVLLDLPGPGAAPERSDRNLRTAT
jgi:hypothetical protein